MFHYSFAFFLTLKKRKETWPSKTGGKCEWARLKIVSMMRRGGRRGGSSICVAENGESEGFNLPEYCQVLTVDTNTVLSIFFVML